jgi:hypothetical protein
MAYDVAKFSLERRASIPVEVAPITQHEVRSRGMYWREPDPLASTEFTYTRFLTPALARWRGWALFCDCDFLWLGDVAGLQEYFDPAIAVYCVKHDYTPTETTKMDGAVQTTYPRKNWSSLMWFNCEHASVRRLTPAAVSGQSAAWLHRMEWAADDEIGALPEAWNWLEGWSTGPAKGVHFTRGGPWFAGWQDVEFAEAWREERALMDRGA